MWNQFVAMWGQLAWIVIATVAGLAVGYVSGLCVGRRRGVEDFGRILGVKASYDMDSGDIVVGSGRPCLRFSRTDGGGLKKLAQTFL